MKRFLNKKGSILLIIQLYALVILMGMALLPLVAVKKQTQQGAIDALFNRYEAESLSRIAITELIEDLPEASASLQYSPLYSDEEHQARLASALLNTYLSSDNYWNYSNLIPTEVTNRPHKLTAKIYGLSIHISNENIQNGLYIDCDPFRVEVEIADMMYVADVVGVAVTYSFSRNRVVCSFDTSNACIENSMLLYQEVSK